MKFLKWKHSNDKILSKLNILKYTDFCLLVQYFNIYEIQSQIINIFQLN